MTAPTGILPVDKPAGCTSHDVVARCRKLLGTRKVGHAGTLDPSATGVLVVGVGPGTRLLRFLGDLPKRYTGEVVFGTTTTTLDADGETTETFQMQVQPEDVAATAQRFVGDISQVPPMVSAVKVDGRRLHELARQGVEVERTARPVTVHSFDVEPTNDPLVYRIEASCSAGTYVRVLAADLGQALGGGAHLRGLRRTAVGPFAVEGAIPLDDVNPEHLLPLRAAVAHLDECAANESLVGDVAHGKVVDLDRVGSGEGPWAVVDGGGELLAVYERYREGLAKPALVISTPQS